MIAPPKPLTMTVICATCTNQYGAWRNHCPACNTATPVSKFEPPITMRNTPRRAPAKREPVWHECAFCHRRGAKKHRCPICSIPVHGGCAAMHEKLCKEFQKEVQTLVEATS